MDNEMEDRLMYGFQKALRPGTHLRKPGLGICYTCSCVWFQGTLPPRTTSDPKHVGQGKSAKLTLRFLRTRYMAESPLSSRKKPCRTRDSDCRKSSLYPMSSISISLACDGSGFRVNIAFRAGGQGATRDFRWPSQRECDRGP